MATKPYTRPTTEKADPLGRENPDNHPLSKINFTLMAAAFAVTVVGFLLMLGAPSTATEFNPDIFSWRRIVAGPTLAFLGYIFMGAAIMWPSRKAKQSETNTTSSQS